MFLPGNEAQMNDSSFRRDFVRSLRIAWRSQSVSSLIAWMPIPCHCGEGAFYTTRKGKSLRRTIWNWLLSKSERTFTAEREAVACFSPSPRDCFAGFGISAECNIKNVDGD
jgi:hypothetical protein